MSAHVLINLLNQLGKRDKLQGLLSILSIFSTILMKSIIQKLDSNYKSYNIKIILK